MSHGSTCWQIIRWDDLAPRWRWGPRSGETHDLEPEIDSSAYLKSSWIPSCWCHAKRRDGDESRLKRIKESCFASCSFKSICIPRNVDIFGNLCFSYSPIQRITFESESQLTCIGVNCFHACPNLCCIDALAEADPATNRRNFDAFHSIKRLIEKNCLEFRSVFSLTLDAVTSSFRVNSEYSLVMHCTFTRHPNHSCFHSRLTRSQWMMLTCMLHCRQSLLIVTDVCGRFTDFVIVHCWSQLRFGRQ
jgi:hypothetical protein